jgi:hypothetical protein
MARNPALLMIAERGPDCRPVHGIRPLDRLASGSEFDRPYDADASVEGGKTSRWLGRTTPFAGARRRASVDDEMTGAARCDRLWPPAMSLL